MSEPVVVRRWRHPALGRVARSSGPPAVVEVLAARLHRASVAAGSARGLVWLDPGGPSAGPEREAVLTAFPTEVRRTWEADAVAPLLDGLAPNGIRLAEDDALTGFRGGWLGFVAYGAVAGLEPVQVRVDDDGPPLVSFAHHPVWFRHRPHDATLELCAAGVSEHAEVPDVSAWVHWAEEALRAPADATTPMHAFDPALAHVAWPDEALIAASTAQAERSFTPQSFEHAVREVQEAIREGEVFQANLAHRLRHETEVEPFAAHVFLRRYNPSPFAAFLHEDWGAIVSNSPERLVRVRGGRIEARPIAGTRPRRPDPAADDAEVRHLRGSAKERAEHTMLVDLLRNDVGRVSVPGSVRVDEFQVVEAYSHVHHLVSNVSGKVGTGTGLSDVVRALFPGGTITGAPKLRSIEVIDRVEPVGRGAYTGSLGYVEPDGSLDLNILIRTLVFHGGKVDVFAGAGIVADSDPASEYEETVHKAAAMLGALSALDRRVAWVGQ